VSKHTALDELTKAVDNLLRSHAFNWYLEGDIERLRVAKERFDIASQSEAQEAQERLLMAAGIPV